MAARLPVYKFCKAPKVFGGPCEHRFEGTAQTCEAHREADPLRQCATELTRGGGRVRCAAWPMPGLPHCTAHDPVAAVLRHEEQQSARVRIAAVRKAVAKAPAHVQGKILDYLVAQRQVEVRAVEAAVRAYWVIS
jgi:hypothetical protein